MRYVWVRPARADAAADRRHRPIQQLIDRRTTFRAGVTGSRGTHPTVAHVNIVSPLVSRRCHIALATTRVPNQVGIRPARAHTQRQAQFSLRTAVS